MISWAYSLLSDGGAVGSAASSTGSFSGLTVPDPAYTELAVDALTGDLHEQPFLARGADAVVQRLRVRFRFFRGEWFLDQRLGIPYRESILVKNPDRILITAIFRQVLLSTPGVASVQKFASILDRAARHLTCDFEATLEDGSIVRAEAEPFIVG